jgi:outer membrane protein TolC
MRKNFFLFLILNLSYFQISGQTVFEFETFRNRVIQFHPVMQQAKLQIIAGENEVKMAKGNLDPSISSNIETKQFNQQEYYTTTSSGLVIPTWLGIDFQAGYEANRGLYTNNQASMPGSGLWYASVKVPLGQGLFFDERRAAIQKARTIQKMTANERILISNDLLLDAYEAYWNWYEMYQKLKIIEEGKSLATERFLNTLQSARFGEIASIDTLESFIQLNTFDLRHVEQLFEYQQARLNLETFLWSTNLIPLELDSLTIPGDFKVEFIDYQQLRFDTIASDRNVLPNQIINSIYKLEQLEIEDCLLRDKLKPKLNIEYNALVQPYGSNQLEAFNASNYKVKASLYYPLFLRQERGKIALNSVKMQTQQLDIIQKKRSLQVKEEVMQEELRQLYKQLELQGNQVTFLSKLLQSEQIKFNIGESSMFLVNTREAKYLDSKTKLASLQTKLKITETKWKWLNSELIQF